MKIFVRFLVLLFRCVPLIFLFSHIQYCFRLFNIFLLGYYCHVYGSFIESEHENSVNFRVLIMNFLLVILTYVILHWKSNLYTPFKFIFVPYFQYICIPVSFFFVYDLQLYCLYPFLLILNCSVLYFIRVVSNFHFLFLFFLTS